MIYIPFFIVILIDKRDDKKEQLTEGTDTSTVIGTSTGYATETSTGNRYKVQGTRYKYRLRYKVQETSTGYATGNRYKVQDTRYKYQETSTGYATNNRY